MSSFDFYGLNDTQLDAYPAGPPNAPTLWLYVRQGHDSANVYIPVDRVEEVVAGLRDMARQAGGQPELAPVAVRLQVADEQAFGDMVRRIVGDGPTGSVE